MTFHVWAIRQKSTGYYMPMERSGRGNGRGFSHDIPIPDAVPRIFITARRAKRALAAWIQGEWEDAFYIDRWGEQEYGGPCPTKVQGRDLNDMEIVEMSLRNWEEKDEI